MSVIIFSAERDPAIPGHTTWTSGEDRSTGESALKNVSVRTYSLMPRGLRMTLARSGIPKRRWKSLRPGWKTDRSTPPFPGSTQIRRPTGNPHSRAIRASRWQSQWRTSAVASARRVAVAIIRLRSARSVKSLPQTETITGSPVSSPAAIPSNGMRIAWTRSGRCRSTSLCKRPRLMWTSAGPMELRMADTRRGVAHCATCALIDGPPTCSSRCGSEAPLRLWPESTRGSDVVSAPGSTLPEIGYEEIA